MKPSNRFLGELSEQDRIDTAAALTALSRHTSWPTFLEIIEAARLSAQAAGFEAEDAEASFKYTQGYLAGLKFVSFLVGEFVSKGDEVAKKDGVRRRLREQFTDGGDTTF